MGVDQGDKKQPDENQPQGLHQDTEKTALDIADPCSQLTVNKRIHNTPLHLPTTQAAQAIGIAGLLTTAFLVELRTAGGSIQRPSVESDR